MVLGRPPSVLNKTARPQVTNVIMHGKGEPDTTSTFNPAPTAGRYSAKKMRKPVNFFFHAPKASKVAVIGDFNDWDPHANLMSRGPDGAWCLQVPLHHGHHRYLFVVDGEPALDPRSQGVARNDQNERVSLMSVS